MPVEVSPLLTDDIAAILVVTEESGQDSILKEFFFFQAEDGIRDLTVTGVQTCALPISSNKYSLIFLGLPWTRSRFSLSLFNWYSTLMWAGRVRRYFRSSSFTIRLVKEIGRASCRERV